MNNIFVGNYKKVFFAVLTAVLIVGSFFITGSVLASATINSAKLNGLNDLAVEGSALITATVNVNLTVRSVWKSTAYRFGNGSWTCVNTPDHIADTTVTETFSIIAPVKVGTSKVYFEVYSNDDCTNNAISGITMSPASLLTSSINILSSNMWLVSLLIVFILLIIAFVVLYYFRKMRKP